MEPLLRQEARYYQNVPEVGISFTAPCSVPPPQFDPHHWQPTLNKDKHKVEGANWFGILLAFLSGAFFTLSSAGVKALKSVDPMELLVLRSLLQVAVMLPITIRKGENILGPKGQRALLQLQVRLNSGTDV
jgi:drug/metabolite transporter (DMT)-like permease